MYELFNKWSIPETYQNENLLELSTRKMPMKTIFRFIEGEMAEFKKSGYYTLTGAQLRCCIGRLDRELVTRVAMSKYVTGQQLYEYMQLQGREEYRDQIYRHIDKLVNMRILQKCCLDKSDIYCYRLDYWGRIIALEEKVTFHTGNVYISEHRKIERNMIEDSAMEIKRILTANMILLGMLKRGISISRFGFMETFHPLDTSSFHLIQGKVPIFRTPLNVAVSLSEIYAFEVVRDCAESYHRLENKIQRYNALCASLDYLLDNCHGYEDAPQFVICGESWEHNQKIRAFLMEKGLWNVSIPLLFTEDLLTLGEQQSFIYEITETKERKWHAMKIAKKNRVA